MAAGSNAMKVHFNLIAVDGGTVGNHLLLTVLYVPNKHVKKVTWRTNRGVVASPLYISFSFW